MKHLTLKKVKKTLTELMSNVEPLQNVTIITWGEDNYKRLQKEVDKYNA